MSPRDQSGATLLESMIAFALMAASAVAVYPVFVMVKKQSKAGDVRQLCENIVRGKLDEYRQGKNTLIANLANPSAGTPVYGGLPAKPQLASLTVSNMAATSVAGLGTAAAQVQAAGGFMYAKLRYNRYFPYACRGTSGAAIHQAAPPTLGMRECVGSARVLNASAPPYLDPVGPPAGCVEPLDAQVAREIPGFKLYVRLQLETPWPLPATGTGWDQQYGTTDGCPITASPSGELYDFDGAGDSIRVTVTGVADIASMGSAPGGLRELGDIQAADRGRLTCSVSSIIQPDLKPVRYMLTREGRIFDVSGHGANGANSRYALQTVYGGGGMMASGIVSFAVHPRNLSVYVLRPGSLVRYGKCGGVPLDCVSTTLDDGISDRGVTPWPSVQEWSVLASIRSIAVDFRRGRIYGLSGDKTQIYELVDQGSGGTLQNVNTRVNAASATTASALPFQMPAAGLPMRLTGFFLAPDGDEAFVSDWKSRASLRGTSYSASIYRITDSELTSPLSTLPANAASFSK